MTPTRPRLTLARLWQWLEPKLSEIDMKLDHILFRLRKEDPRIPDEEFNAEFGATDYETEEIRDI